MTSRLFALVDYDNQRPSSWRGRLPNARDHELYLAELERGLLAFRGSINEEFLELRVRLYGGWTSESSGRRTASGDMVSQALASNGAVRRVGRTRIFLELVDSLISAPDEPLYRTYRKDLWRGDLLAVGSQPVTCPDHPNLCAEMLALRSWSSHSRCPRQATCAVKTRDFTHVTGQKLVDSMLVADAITCAVARDRVAIVSIDDDMVPGALSASRLGGDVSLVRFGKTKQSDYDPILQRNGVEVVDFPGLAV